MRLALYTVEGVPMATAGPEMGAFIRAELVARGIGFFPQKTVARVDVAARRIEFEVPQVAITVALVAFVAEPAGFVAKLLHLVRFGRLVEDV